MISSLLWLSTQCCEKMNLLKQELKSYISLYEYKALKKDIKGFFLPGSYKENLLYGALFGPLRKSIELKLDLYQG